MVNAITSNLAWFRLSEALIRNEREKAFIAYRLLSHSLSSDGFKNQVLGDLHYSFGEMSLAVDSYKHAFNFYCEKKDIFGMIIIIKRLLWNIENITFFLEKIYECTDLKNELYEVIFSEIGQESNILFSKKIKQKTKQL
jgi:hypothetical protein